MTGERYEGGNVWCPGCNENLAVAQVERVDSRSRPPLHGDLTVCGHCTMYLRYVEEPAGPKLVVVERDEFEGLAEKYQSSLMQTRARLIQAGAGNMQAPPLAVSMAHEIAKLKQQMSALRTASCSCLYCNSGDGFNCIHRRTA